MLFAPADVLLDSLLDLIKYAYSDRLISVEHHGLQGYKTKPSP